MALINLGGRRPATLGAGLGRLAPCPADRGNCVCSQYGSTQPGGGPHHLPPLRFAGSPAQAMSRLIVVVRRRAEATIVEKRPNYLHAEFARIGWLGLIDDVEFLLQADADDTGGVIQARSASRGPIPDFGLNRARIEAIREDFDEMA